MSNLTDNLADAWLARYQRATGTLGHVAAAPALFRPEYVAEVVAEQERSGAEYRRWLRQSVAS